MSGRGPSYGAELGITDNYLTVSPINTKGAQRLLGLGAHAAGVHGFGGVNQAINLAKPDPQMIPLSEITSVSAGSGRGYFSPPTARIETTRGEYEFGVAGDIWTRNGSSRARDARDSFIQTLDRLRVGA